MSKKQDYQDREMAEGGHQQVETNLEEIPSFQVLVKSKILTKINLGQYFKKLFNYYMWVIC